MKERSGKRVFGAIFVTPLLIALAIVMSPLLILAGFGYGIGTVWLASRLLGTWPAGTFVLLGYTQSPLWAPFIEQHLVPRLGDVVVAVDRSNEAWKRTYPIEARALKFWGGIRSYNPIAIVIRRPWRVRVFRFYEAFRKSKHGQPHELEAQVSALLAYVKSAGAGVRSGNFRRPR